MTEDTPSEDTSSGADITHEDLPRDAIAPELDGDASGDNGALASEPSLETELQEARDKHLRLAAEFENFKKRTTRERSESMKFSNERILKDFLSIVDNLERALHHAKEGSEGESLVQGVELVYKQCTELLTRFNVTAVHGVGAEFDPVVHQAVSNIETDEHPHNTVADEFQKGYKLHDRLLRPALVTVAKPKNAESLESADSAKNNN